MDANAVTKVQAAEYNIVIRQVTWGVLGVLLITLPLGTPQTLAIAVLIGLGFVANLLCYTRWWLSKPALTSRITVLVLDNIFIAILLFLAQRVEMTYTALIILTIVTATFWYGYRGLIAVVAGQGVALTIVSLGILRVFPPLPIDPTRALIVAVAVLLALGFLLERLTRVRRVEREEIEQLAIMSSLNEAWAAALLETRTDAVVVTNVSGQVVTANTAFCELVGSKDVPTGESLPELLPLRHADVRLDWARIFQTAPQHINEYETVGGEGKSIPLDVAVTAVTSPGKGTVGYVVVSKNMAVQQSLNEERTSFFAIASHELRTPMTFIEAALSMALAPQSGVNDQVRDMLQKAHDNTKFVSRLVDDLTTLYMAQNDAISLQLKSLDARGLVEQVVADYASEASDKQLVLTSDVAESLSPVLTSESYVVQILRNLVSNAIKYTETGTVTVSAQPGVNNGLLLSVKDTGVGISKINEEKLFTQIFQAEDYETRQSGGTGIGLYLSAQLARRINARLWFESELDQGSTFYLEVPPLGGLEKDAGKAVSAGVDTLLQQI